MTDAIAEQPQCPVCAHFGERDAAIPFAGVTQFAAAHPEVAGPSLPGRARLQLRSAPQL